MGTGPLSPVGPTRLYGIPSAPPITRTPLRLASWAALLRDHPDQHLVRSALEDLEFGAPLAFSGIEGWPSIAAHNLPSARSPAAVDTLLTMVAEDIKLGRTIGPFSPSNAPFSHFSVSPVGLLAKEVWASDGTTRTKLRKLAHLSHPFGGYSVNAGLHPAKLKYASLDDAVEAILRLGGRGVFMAKLDVKSAFRLIPVNPSDIPLLGFMLGGLLFFDTVLPFGLRRSPEVWDKHAGLLAWILSDAFRARGLNVLVIFYVDDFLLIGPSFEAVREAVWLSVSIGNFLGLPWELTKLLGPASSLPFVGIGVDAERLALFVPPEKVAELNKLLEVWSTRVSASRSQARSLAGKLVAVSRAIKSARTFYRRILDFGNSFPTTATANTPQLPVPEEVRRDIRWWQTFLPLAPSAVPFSPVVWHPAHVSVLTTDSSGHAGGALLFQPRGSAIPWFSYPWPAEVLSMASDGDSNFSINFLELATVLVALACWPRAGGQLLIRSDNLGAVAAINSGTSSYPRMMYLIRRIWLLCSIHSVALRAVHIPGIENVQADALSRGDIAKFRHLTPTAMIAATIPPADWFQSHLDI